MSHAAAENRDTYLRGFPLKLSRLTVLASCALLVATFLAACNNGPAPVTEVEVSTRWATAHASSVVALTEFADEVFVGRVVALDRVRFETLAPPASSPNAERNSEKPRFEGLQDFPFSVFHVEVVRSIDGSLAAGEIVEIEQPGGPATSNGAPVHVSLEDDPGIEPGGTYLFFASAAGRGLYAPPFARMGVATNGALDPPEGWEDTPALATLSAMNVEQAALEVEALVPR
jgi:hypothetical protein